MVSYYISFIDRFLNMNLLTISIVFGSGNDVVLFSFEDLLPFTTSLIYRKRISLTDSKKFKNSEAFKAVTSMDAFCVMALGDLTTNQI